MKRRNFFRSIALGGVGAALTPVAKAASSLASEKMKPQTNVKQALAIPRNEYSMPGKYPGKVVKMNSAHGVVDGKPSEAVAYEMLKSGMLYLTGLAALRRAGRCHWLESKSDSGKALVYFTCGHPIRYQAIGGSRYSPEESYYLGPS